MAKKHYDFAGWATKNNLLCADGRTIRGNAFAGQDGTRVPLVWQHGRDDPANILGYADLEKCSDGVKAFCNFNDSDSAKYAKESVEHGDIKDLSIYANHLVQDAQGNVFDGKIKEVSLVVSGANPGAHIIDTALMHSDGTQELIDEAEIYTGEGITLMHSDDKGDNMAANGDNSSSNGVTVKSLFESALKKLSDDEKKAIYAVIGMASDQGAADDGSDESESMSHSDENNDSGYDNNGYYHGDVYEGEDGKLYDEAGNELEEIVEHSDEGGNKMAFNAFDQDSYNGSGVPATYSNVLQHDDVHQIMQGIKRFGSLRESLNNWATEHSDELEHSGIVKTGEKGLNMGYGISNIDMLFPDAKDITTTPEFIKRETEWVATVMNSTKHMPWTRIKSTFADITADEARARGYITGKLKKEEVFSLLRRTTDPQTIYKKQKLDRDYVLDITDFDVVVWIKSEMRIMLDEEIARAILVGDGRLASDEDHISEDHIRPIWKEAELFTIYQRVSYKDSDDANTKGRAFINAAIKARKDYKGSGEPTLFTTEDQLTDLLLMTDTTGRDLYTSVEQLATKLRVSKIVTVPVMEGLVRDADATNHPTYDTAGKKYVLDGIIVNLTDYAVGSDKGGQVSMFDDFDIDYNQQKYLIETRISGALTKPKSAIILEHEQASTTSSGTSGSGHSGSGS